MRILFLGDPSPNTFNWIKALRFQPGVTVHLWSMERFRGLMKWLSVPIAIVQVWRLTKTFRPNVVIGYRTTSYGFIGACSGFRPLVIAAQGESDVWPPGHWSNLFTERMARVAIKRAGIIHAWGENMAHALFRLGADRSKVLIGHRGILLDQFTYHEPFGERNAITFVCTRSLYAEYHHDLVLDVLKALEDFFLDIQFLLVVIGDGSRKEFLVHYANELCLRSEIKWVGRIPPDHVLDWLTKSDIYISLPDTEGVSSSLLEAMASGCYPIVTDLPANREWIQDSVNGRLVSHRLEEIVDICKEVVQNRYDLMPGIEENRKRIEHVADATIINAFFIDRYRKLL
jgi:glycosyltransferase involved in cell wall biosynthesis